MNEIQPDEVLRNGFQQTIAVGLQLWGTWEQRQQRELLRRQVELEQEQTEVLEERHQGQGDRGRDDQRDRDTRRPQMDQERIRQSWPLVDQVTEAWAEQAGHEDLARSWAFAEQAEQMVTDPARRASAASAADVIEGQLRRRAPSTMRQYDDARARGASRLQAMQPLAEALDGEAVATAAARPRTAGPTAATTRTPGPATASATRATPADRIRQACRNAAASWGARPFARPATSAGTATHTDPSRTATATPEPRRGR